MGAIDDIRIAITGANPRQHLDTEWNFNEVRSRALNLPAMAGMAACHLDADTREVTFEVGNESLFVRSSALLLGTCPRDHLVAAAMASGNLEFQAVYTFSWGRGFLGIEERAASADGRISEGDVLGLDGRDMQVRNSANGGISLFPLSHGIARLSLHHDFALVGGVWVYSSSTRLSASQGRRIAGLLNEIQAHYTSALNQAAAHVR